MALRSYDDLSRVELVSNMLDGLKPGSVPEEKGIAPFSLWQGMFDAYSLADELIKEKTSFQNTQKSEDLLYIMKYRQNIAEYFLSTALKESGYERTQCYLVKKALELSPRTSAKAIIQFLEDPKSNFKFLQDSTIRHAVTDHICKEWTAAQIKQRFDFKPVLSLVPAYPLAEEKAPNPTPKIREWLETPVDESWLDFKKQFLKTSTTSIERLKDAAFSTSKKDALNGDSLAVSDTHERKHLVPTDATSSLLDVSLSEQKQTKDELLKRTLREWFQFTKVDASVFIEFYEKLNSVLKELGDKTQAAEIILAEVANAHRIGIICSEVRTYLIKKALDNVSLSLDDPQRVALRNAILFRGAGSIYGLADQSSLTLSQAMTDELKTGLSIDFACCLEKTPRRWQCEEQIFKLREQGFDLKMIAQNLLKGCMFGIEQRSDQKAFNSLTPQVQISNNAMRYMFKKAFDLAPQMACESLLENFDEEKITQGDLDFPNGRLRWLQDSTIREAIVKYFISKGDKSILCNIRDRKGDTINLFLHDWLSAPASQAGMKTRSAWQQFMFKIGAPAISATEIDSGRKDGVGVDGSIAKNGYVYTPGRTDSIQAIINCIKEKEGIVAQEPVASFRTSI